MLKNPARVPGLLLRRKASLSAVSAYLSPLFLSNSRPTSAFMIARKPRTDAPVCRLTSSTFFAPRESVENLVRRRRADDQGRSVGKKQTASNVLESPWVLRFSSWKFSDDRLKHRL